MTDKDVVEFNAFMSSPVRRTMPRVMISETLRGDCYHNTEFRTDSMQLRSLRESYSKDVADKISPEGNQEIPIVRRIGKPNYYVYHPQTGRYVGSFKVNP